MKLIEYVADLATIMSLAIKELDYCLPSLAFSFFAFAVFYRELF